MQTKASAKGPKLPSEASLDINDLDIEMKSRSAKRVWVSILVIWGILTCLELAYYLDVWPITNHNILVLGAWASLLAIVCFCIRQVPRTPTVHVALNTFIVIVLYRMATMVIQDLPAVENLPFIGIHGKWRVVVIRAVDFGAVCSLLTAFSVALISLKHSRERLVEQAEMLKETIRQRDVIQDSARSNERYFQAVYDVVPDVIFIKDIEGRYLSANRASEVMFKVNRTESIG